MCCFNKRYQNSHNSMLLYSNCFWMIYLMASLKKFPIAWKVLCYLYLSWSFVNWNMRHVRMESLPKAHNQNIQWKYRGPSQPLRFLISPAVNLAICMQGITSSVKLCFIFYNNFNLSSVNMQHAVMAVLTGVFSVSFSTLLSFVWFWMCKLHTPKKAIVLAKFYLNNVFNMLKKLLKC